MECRCVINSGCATINRDYSGEPCPPCRQRKWRLISAITIDRSPWRRILKYYRPGVTHFLIVTITGNRVTRSEELLPPTRVVPPLQA